MSVPKVEVETESAGRYDDVDLETLHRLVAQLSIDSSYVIVHRADKPDEFAQAALERSPSAKTVKGSYIVEFRDLLGAQYQAKANDIGRVQTALAGWAFDLAGWENDLKWKALKLNKVINFRGTCTVSESDGSWTASFPPLDLSATGATEEEARAELQTVVGETINQDPAKREVWAKWASKNLIEVSPEELERIKSRKLSSEQAERINRSYADSLRTRGPKKRKS